MQRTEMKEVEQRKQKKILSAKTTDGENSFKFVRRADAAREREETARVGKEQVMESLETDAEGEGVWGDGRGRMNTRRGRGEKYLLCG